MQSGGWEIPGFLATASSLEIDNESRRSFFLHVNLDTLSDSRSAPLHHKPQVTDVGAPSTTSSIYNIYMLHVYDTVY